MTSGEPANGAARPKAGSKRSLIIGGVIVLLLVAANSGGGSGLGGDGADPAPAGDAAPAGGASGETLARVGTPVVVKGTEVTVLEAETWPGDGQFREPTAGFVFVGFRVRVKSIDADHVISSGSFAVASSNGQQGNSAILGKESWEPSLIFEDVKKGQFVEGWIVFEVKQTLDFDLTYDDSAFDDTVDVRWQFTQ